MLFVCVYICSSCLIDWFVCSCVIAWLRCVCLFLCVCFVFCVFGLDMFGMFVYVFFDRSA